MASKIIIANSQAVSVYDDRFFPILQALGTPQIERATDVEYINGEWVATHRATNQIIARGPNRNQVIKEEVTWLEERGLNCHIR